MDFFFFFYLAWEFTQVSKDKVKPEFGCHISEWESAGQSVKPEATSCQKRALLDVRSAIFTELPWGVQLIPVTDPAQQPFYSCCYLPDFGPSKMVALLLTEHWARVFHASGWMRNHQKGTHSDTVSDSTLQEICWDTQQIGHNLNLSVTGDGCMFIGFFLNNGEEQQIQLWMGY